MAASIRIYDLARELKQEPKRIIQDLRREGADVSVPSSSVSKELAAKIRKMYFPQIETAPKRTIKVIRKKTPTENPPSVVTERTVQSPAQNAKDKYNELPGKNSEVPRNYALDNENLRVDCLKCHTSTKHNLIHFSKVSDIKLIEEYQIIQCLNCDSFSFRRTIGSNQSKNEMAVDLYPSRITGRQKLQLEHIPPTIAQMYDEIHSALSSRLLIVATSGMRTLIELVCNDQNSRAKNLMGKIDDLVERKLLTQKNANNLHKLRDYGNEAAHEANIQAEATLYRCMDIIEHLLKDIYLPEITD